MDFEFLVIMRFNFSIRSLFLLLLVWGVILHYAELTIRQRDIVNAIIAFNGNVFYGNGRLQFGKNDTLMAHACHRATFVNLFPSPECSADEQIEVVSHLAYLRTLVVCNGFWSKNERSCNDFRIDGGLSDAGIKTLIHSKLSPKGIVVTAARCSDLALVELASRFDSTHIKVNFYDPRRGDFVYSPP